MSLKSFTSDWTPSAMKFVWIHTLFTGMTAILTLFVNTFLLNAYGSFSAEVLLYNVVMAVVQPVAMLTSLKLTQVKSALFTQRIGFIFYGLALIVLCLFGEAVSGLYPLFAVLLSFGGGYYFSVYSSQMLCYTTDQNRDRIAGVVGLLGSIISILLPLLSGFLVVQCGATLGYQIVFGIAALLAICSLLINKGLSPLPVHQKPAVMKMVCKRILSSKRGRLIMVANGLSNCHSFTLPIFVTLLFYNLVSNELLISTNNAIGYVVALLGSAVYSSVVKSGNRVKFNVAAALISTIPVLCMLLDLNIILIIIFNAVYGFFNIFHATPVLNTHFKEMEELGLGGEYGAEVHLVRELFVSAGRILGLLLIWVVPQTNLGAVFVLLGLSLIELINSAILRKLEKE